jgi:hypothetical protein
VAQSGLGNGIIIKGYNIFFFGAGGAVSLSSQGYPKIVLISHSSAFL